MTILRSALVYMGLRGGLSGAILGGLYGTFFFPIIGTIFGVMLGGGAGIILGVFDAAILAIIHTLFSATPENKKAYHLTSVLTVTGFTFVATPFALASLLNESYFYIDWILMLPAFIAAVASGIVCHSFLKKQSRTHMKKVKG